MPGIASPASKRRADVLLVVVCLAQFMVILDVAIVNVALPSIRTGLDFSDTGLQWVVNAYTLTFAGFLMLGGRAADLLGRRRMFVAGVVLFSVASLACAVAESPGLLLAARALQGIGGAVVSPTSLSIIATSFAEGRERNRALGAWAAISGLGAASGSILGGLLTSGFGWPAIFLINVPLGVVVILGGLRVVPADLRVERVGGSFDLSGAVLVTAGLVALTYGIVRTESLGWGAPGVLGPLAAAVALLGLFALVEGRLARAPLVPLSVFRMKQLRTSNIVVLLLYSAQFAMWFFLTLYLQQVLGLSALEAGLAFVPLTLAVVTGSTLAPRVVARFGLRAALTAGMLSGAAGLALLTSVSAGGSYVTQVLPGGMLASFGLGSSLVPATIAAVEGVAPAQAGLASGLLNTSRLLGGALGLAVLGTLAASHTQHAAGSPLAALADGFQLAFQLGALLCLTGAAVAALLLRSPREVAVVEAPAAPFRGEDPDTIAA
jgi:EmrB/QacA subfamily drug resistance transporter